MQKKNYSSWKNPLNDHLIYKDDKKRVLKPRASSAGDNEGLDSSSLIQIDKHIEINA